MKLKLVQDKLNKIKTKRLGDFGERLAMELLERAGFQNVRDLNAEAMNYPYADLVCERGGKRYVVSVKTRLKYERLGGLNARYNLGKDWRRKARLAEQEKDAIASWVTIQVDTTGYSAYFGLLSLVEESNGIPMQPEAIKYYECLAEGEEHNLRIEDYTPEYQVSVEGRLR
jgi:Holliday junction resolvase-like predicted endonuclease